MVPIEVLLKSIEGAIFDLDGVIVDTAKYHYSAWKKLANMLGFEFTEKDNEKLKGVSRKESLEILLKIGGKENEFSRAQREELMDIKNNWYLEYIVKLTEDDILPGTKETILTLKEQGIKVGLATASKNAMLILERLKIKDLFDAIVDGTQISRAKPDPEIFLKCAQKLEVDPKKCIVFEDAAAGIKAAKLAGMFAVGVGSLDTLSEADIVVSSLAQLVKELN
ncbi:beta-phosphoglucomutase [Caldicellulosiruptor kronotskyensis 2002]|uniref:Beta-phosphoglucomutase n=1 Tax=Caldicellulosiruptor kronotskyensis (strain DSM 18902 / VKM B-2412 / 2002) TaxID=632348 RepID=E4SCF0_CALK2|nr:beta-phosphoglucomutase [Caldicellulosiruptor kronotskyensis]ADQ45005.1 beta-phosphoglucomutase [Caldicellulosiruptor kronotskyensis 2002]